MQFNVHFINYIAKSGELSRAGAEALAGLFSTHSYYVVTKQVNRKIAMSAIKSFCGCLSFTFL